MLHASDFGISFKQIQEKLILKNANTNIILKKISIFLRPCNGCKLTPQSKHWMTSYNHDDFVFTIYCTCIMYVCIHVRIDNWIIIRQLILHSNLLKHFHFRFAKNDHASRTIWEIPNQFEIDKILLEKMITLYKSSWNLCHLQRKLVPLSLYFRLPIDQGWLCSGGNKLCTYRPWVAIEKNWNV